jgi:HK97 family phage major capsid protein
MRGLNNMTLLQKADLALSDLTSGGGILQPAQAQKFLRILIDESKLLRFSTVVPMKAQKQEVDKIRFGSRILRAGSEGVALSQADRSKPDTSKVELDSKLFKAEVRLTNETLEDNIEREQLRQTIMQLMAEAISRDVDEVIVQGDTASADAFLAQLNGILKQATSNIVDAGVTNLAKTILRDMIKAMPKPFLRNKETLRFMTSVDAEIDYRDSLAGRETQVGDDALVKATKALYNGIAIEEIPLFPETLGVGTNETNVILTDPKNINVGFWREIRFETDKDVSAGVVIIVATLRMDVKYAEETAVVKATKVKVTS